MCDEKHSNKSKSAYIIKQKIKPKPNHENPSPQSYPQQKQQKQEKKTHEYSTHERDSKTEVMCKKRRNQRTQTLTADPYPRAASLCWSPPPHECRPGTWDSCRPQATTPLCLGPRS